MEEYAQLTVFSCEAETQAEFNKRLIDFWTRLLRVSPEEYKRVYAETARFEARGQRFARRYLVGRDICDMIERELVTSQIDFEPMDVNELYSKYEAAAPEWFQIPH